MRSEGDSRLQTLKHPPVCSISDEKRGPYSARRGEDARSVFLSLSFNLLLRSLSPLLTLKSALPAEEQYHRWMHWLVGAGDVLN